MEYQNMRRVVSTDTVSATSFTSSGVREMGEWRWWSSEQVSEACGRGVVRNWYSPQERFAGWLRSSPCASKMSSLSSTYIFIYHHPYHSLRIQRFFASGFSLKLFSILSSSISTQQHQPHHRQNDNLPASVIFSFPFVSITSLTWQEHQPGLVGADGSCNFGQASPGTRTAAPGNPAERLVTSATLYCICTYIYVIYTIYRNCAFNSSYRKIPEC